MTYQYGVLTQYAENDGNGTALFVHTNEDGNSEYTYYHKELDMHIATNGQQVDVRFKYPRTADPIIKLDKHFSRIAAWPSEILKHMATINESNN